MNIIIGSDSSVNGEYYYLRNLQGDIIGLIDKNGIEVVSYTYDTWGKLVYIEGSLKGHCIGRFYFISRKPIFLFLINIVILMLQPI